MAGKASGIRAGRAFIELTSEDSKLRAGLKATEMRLMAFGRGLASVGSIAAGLGVAISTPLLGAAKLFADTGSELADMSARTGMSVEALSALGHAATQTGTDLATVEGAARKLQKNIVAAAMGSQEMEAAFLAIGLSSQRLLRLSPDEQFAALADAIARLPNPTAKTAAAMTLLGKSGAALIPMIDDLGSLTDEARKLGLVMSTDDAEAADRLGDAMDIVVKVVKRAVVAIGAALAPTLTDLSEKITTNLVATTEWITQHRGLIVTAAKSAVALIAIGGGIAALGAALSTMGTVVGAAAATLGAIGAAITALATPIGVVVASLAGLTTWFFLATDAGSQSLAWLGERFTELRDTAVLAFGGIADALAAGEIQLAGQILWASLRVMWLQGTSDLQSVWLDWTTAAKEVFAGFSYSLASLMTDAWAGIQTVWAEGIGWIASSWSTLLAAMVKMLLPFADIVSRMFGVDIKQAIENGLGGSPDAEGVQRQTDLQVMGIEQSRRDQQAALTDQQNAEIENRRALAQATREANQAEIDKALGELESLRKSAADKRAALTGTAGAAVKPPAFSPDELDAALTDAKAKIDVAGSFNAAALSGLAAGDSVANDQLKEQKKATTQLEKLNRHAATGRLVFTA